MEGKEVHMAKRGRKTNGFRDEYLSYKNCGVDTAQFYYDMGTTINQVSTKTGVCREAITRFVANHTAASTNEKIVSYLEECIISDYRDTIQECRKQIDDIKKQTNDAWEIYLKREEMLEERRKKHHINRLYPMERQIREEEILEKK